MGSRPEVTPGRAAGRAVGRGRGGRGRGRGRGRGGKQKSHPNNNNNNNNSNNGWHKNGDELEGSTNRPSTSETATATVSTATTNTSLDPNVTDSVRDLINHMQIINNTIGNTISSSQKSRNNNEQECIISTATLVELQSHVQEAMKRVEKMNVSLTMLQTHANLVQKSLEKISSTVLSSNSSSGNNTPTQSVDAAPPPINGTSSSSMNVGNPPNLVTPVAAEEGGKHKTTRTLTVDNGQKQSLEVLDTASVSWEEKPLQESSKRGSNPPTSKSRGEVLSKMERKKNGSNKLPLTPAKVEESNTTSSVKDVHTLDSLIKSCGDYLTGSHTEYTAWLRRELDVNTITELAEALSECPELLIAGNGSVSIGQTRKFCALVSAAAGAAATTVHQASNDDDSFKSCQSNDKEEEAEEVSGNWACSICTCINPKLFLACSACGAKPASSEWATVGGTESGKNNVSSSTTMTTNLQKQAEEKKRQEANAKKQRKKAKQAADLARKIEEEERATAAAEKLRRALQKREKQEAMLRHEAEVNEKHENEEGKTSFTRTRRRPEGTIPTSTSSVSSTTNGTKTEPSRQLSTNKSKMKSTTSTIRRKKKVVVDKLSYYIKPPMGRKVGKKVSPIFSLIQNDSTVEVGRRLLKLEGETRSCREELAETLALRVRLERGIKMEQQLVKTSKKQIEDQEKKIKSKWNIFGLAKFDEKEVHKKLISLDDDEKARLKQQDAEDEKLEQEEKGEDEADSDGELELEVDGVDEGELEDGNDEEPTNENIDKARDDNKGEKEEKAAIQTLEELIDSCQDLLHTGSSSEYLAFLHSQKIHNINDLGVAVITDDLPLPPNSNVGVIPGLMQTFVSTVLAAVAGSQPKMEVETRIISQDEQDKAADTRLRKKIARQVVQLKEDKKRSKRYNEVKIAKEKVDLLKKTIATSEKALDSQKLQLVSIIPSLRTTMLHLKELRAEIASIKGDGMEEDVNFDIDRNRDERGFTFLMVAAHNNDFMTAKTCFQLNANPSVTTGLEGLAAIDFSYFFGFEHITNLILQNGGILPKKQSEAWDALDAMVPHSTGSKNWEDTLRVAETAALPAETLLESPEACENDAEKKMPLLTTAQTGQDFTCFESRLVDPNINSDQVQRVVYLDQSVYHWILSSTDQTTRSNFANLLEGLKPAEVRRKGVQQTRIRRRSIIGAATTYELLSAQFKSSKGDKTALFTPFVSGEVNGVTSVGVLVWAVTSDKEASLYKTLIANTEFMRHKVQLDDRFRAHKEGVLELGKDMYLLDLKSTSIWTTSTMNLYILNLDNGDLEKILDDPAFTAKKRIVHSEAQVNKAIFRTSQEEANEEDGILASERLDMSSLLTGGAGTGKTLLIIKKCEQEDQSRKVLVVSRLPRLVNIIKTAVEERRDDGVHNQSFTTYEELLQLLARRVVPDLDSDYKSFVQFDRIRFDCDESNISFFRQFISEYLNTKEKKDMSTNSIEALTLWHAIIVIKSQSKCAILKEPLTLDDYLALPQSFGLTANQRQFCYGLFLKYEHWRESERYWDEMDRVLYVLRFGPSVFRDDPFIPWAHRVNRFGQIDLLDDNGEPLYPFFYDIVCADEAQDFTEIDLVLFAKMSASIRSLFLSADPAQSVELGVKMREGTVNDVIHSLINDGKRQVKDVLQYISLQTNHRTHAQNLAISQAVRRILARSFNVPITNERALINGNLPKTLHVSSLHNLADASTFCGGNIVFLAPDEKVHDLRVQLSELGVQNDIFGVREAKGLEFDACALIGFFSFIEECGSSAEWRNVLRWLSSSNGLNITSSPAEIVAGVRLDDCDYRLSAPNVSDEAMMLYTAMTRARNNLYLIEVAHGKGKKQKSAPLADFAFRRFADLGLAKQVTRIDEGAVEMTPSQHKARGVLLVTQALNMSRNHSPIASVKEKFTEAMNRFRPNKGDDKELLDKCEKHFNAILQKHSLMLYAKEKFLRNGEYNLEGRFPEVLRFEQKASKFFSSFLCDSFLVEEVHELRCLVEEIFDGTPYESHFKDICKTIGKLEQAV